MNTQFPLLHCLIITYNRSVRLDRAIGGLVPIAGQFPITILNNASTDNTKEVLALWKSRIPQLEVVNHDYNMGLGANLLRACEISRGTYTWILSDDDELQLEKMDEITAVMQKGEVALISLSNHLRPSGVAGRTWSFRTCMENRFPFFSSLVFVTNTIFKTSYLNSENMHSGYRLAHTMLPQFPLFVSMAQQNASIYFSETSMVNKRMDDGSNWPFSKMLLGWLECSSLIADDEIRAYAERDLFHSRKPNWFLIPYVTLLCHARDEAGGSLFTDCLRYLKGLAFFTQLLALAGRLLPSGFWRILFRAAGFGEKLGQGFNRKMDQEVLFRH